MNNLEKRQYWIDVCGLVAMGVFSLAYILFGKFFAELHIQIPFLDFPIFVGEILLLTCVALFFFKYKNNILIVNRWHYFVIGYFAFIIIKAIYGYWVWGPLAFRHAALFYYPMFIILGYVFYERKFFKDWATLAILLVLFLMFITKKFESPWILTCFLTATIFIRGYWPKKNIKYFLFALLLIVTPYKFLFRASRMMLLSNFISILFVLSVFWKILNVRLKVKVIAAILGVFFAVWGTWMYADANAVRSLMSIKKVVQLYNFYNEKIVAKRDGFKIMDRGNREIRVYNPDKIEKNSGERPLLERLSIEEQKAMELDKKKEEYSLKGLQAILEDGQKKPDFLRKKDKRVERSFNAACMNVVFRLFIWRDLLFDLNKEKKVIGFDFGKPFRSVSLEIIHWGYVDWLRDGWIGAHNSYLHMIYRSGIVGIGFIMTILMALVRMIKGFIKVKSITGILLSAIIINWFIAANFLLIFELPYTAIPIWTVYGITLAYYHSLKINPSETNISS